MTEFSNSVKDMAERLKKDKKALITVIVGLSGMLLIMLSELPLFSSSPGNVPIPRAANTRRET